MRKNDALNDRIGVLVEREKKRKTIFVLSTKGKDLSQAVREMLDKYAEEFDEMQKK